MRPKSNFGGSGLFAFLFALLLVGLSACKSDDKGDSNNGQVSDSLPTANSTTESASPLPCFLAISDIHLDANTDTVEYHYNSRGKLRVGDTGSILWDFTKAKIDTVISSQQPKFIIYLGDMPAHEGSPGDVHTDDITQVLKDLREMATNAKIPLLYAAGNNDATLGDYFPFSNTPNCKACGNTTCTPFDLDKGHCQEWPLIGAGTGADDPQVLPLDPKYKGQGYYSAYPLGKSAKLRTIVMNTVIYNNSSGDQYPPKEKERQAKDQMDWLKAELEAASADSEHVMILMHIPPGLDGYGSDPDEGEYSYMWDTKLKTQSGDYILDAFIDLVNQPQYDITSIFYSHTHMDEIRLIPSKDGKSISRVAISLPGITPTHDNNPGFKTVTYDPSNGFAPVDFTTYYSTFFPDLKSVAYAPANHYTFRESYGYAGKGSILEAVTSIGSPDPNTGVDEEAVLKGMTETYLVKHSTPPTALSAGDEAALFVEKVGAQQPMPTPAN